MGHPLTPLLSSSTTIHHWYIPFLHKQRIPPEQFCSPQLGPHFLPSSWLCCWPLPAACWAERSNQAYSLSLSGLTQFQMKSSSQVCICQCAVLPHHLAFEEGCWEVSWPFEVMAQACSRSYTLQFPESMHAVHWVFHVSMLKHTTPNFILNQVQAPLPPVKIDGEPEYEISKILDSKINWCQRPCNLLYLVQWSGYEGTDEETSWILVTKLGHASEIVTEFHAAYPTKPGPWVP